MCHLYNGYVKLPEGITNLGLSAQFQEVFPIRSTAKNHHVPCWKLPIEGIYQRVKHLMSMVMTQEPIEDGGTYHICLAYVSGPDLSGKNPTFFSYRRKYGTLKRTSMYWILKISHWSWIISAIHQAAWWVHAAGNSSGLLLWISSKRWGAGGMTEAMA